MIKPTLLMLHGMFGAAENWDKCADILGRTWKLCVPELPVWDLPHAETGVTRLVDHVEHLMDRDGIQRAAVAGNSLGGHIALELAIRRPDRIVALVLMGSSGLFERGLEGQAPRRPSREWVRNKMYEVFYDKSHVTDALVEEVYHTISDPRRIIKIIRMAKSAKQSNMSAVLHRIQCPVLLVWGEEDEITPAASAHDFKRHIPHAELEFIRGCGHAPNIERPQEVSALMGDFLERHCAALNR